MSKEVQLFATCLIDTFFPEVGEAVIEVLTHSGVDVVFPPTQTCCGQPAYNAGHHSQARQMAERTIAMLEERPAPIVIPSGSCAAMVRHGYLELFKGVPHWLERARNVAARTREFTEYIVELPSVYSSSDKCPERLAYHPSCHLLRDLDIDWQPMSILTSLTEGRVHRLSDDCCGFGGVFAVTHSEISGEMLGRKLDEIESVGVDLVAGCDVSCLLQIEGGLRKVGSEIRCAHVAQLLAGRSVGLS